MACVEELPHVMAEASASLRWIITVQSGTVWLTRQHAYRDVVLGPGQSFRVPDSCTIQALPLHGDARLLLTCRPQSAVAAADGAAGAPGRRARAFAGLAERVRRLARTAVGFAVELLRTLALSPQSQWGEREALRGLDEMSDWQLKDLGLSRDQLFPEQLRDRIRWLG